MPLPNIRLDSTELANPWKVSTFVLIFLSAVWTVGCAPERSPPAAPTGSPLPTVSSSASAAAGRNSAALDAVNARLEELNPDLLRDEYEQLQSFQNTVLDQQDQLQNFRAQGELLSAAPASQSAASQFESSQEALQWRDYRDGLRKNIADQEALVNQAQQSLLSTLAPDDSDLMVGLRADLLKKQSDLEALKNQYGSSITSEVEIQRQANASQAALAEQQQEDKVDLELLISSTESGIAAAIDSYNQLKSRMLDQRKERTTLLRQKDELLRNP